MQGERQEMSLGYFVKVAANIGQSEFLRHFREPVLLAMGVLETAELEARTGATTEVQVTEPAAYDRVSIHPLAGQVFRLPVLSYPQGSFIIGREAPAEIVVPDETVSVRHAALTWNKLVVSVSDLGSTNGTMVNLRLLERNEAVELMDEDIVTVGRHSFQFYRPLHFYQTLRTIASEVEGEPEAGGP